MFYKKNFNLCSKFKSADKLLAELKLMTICCKNLYYALELQKQIHNKNIKPKNYAPDDKIWLNNKYLKTKQKQKLETKFFELF